MAKTDSLWTNSGVWRWLLCATLALTGLLILLKPASNQIAVPPLGGAQYNAPVLPSAAPTTPAGGLKPAATSTAVHAPVDPSFGFATTPQDQVFSSDTELHVIGVYEPALPPGVDPNPLSQCNSLVGDMTAMLACHAKYRRPRTVDPITVYVNKTSHPVVLALMAYESAQWKIVSRPGVELKKVILAGYKGQDIEGIDESIPVESYSYEGGLCSNCTTKSGHFYAYEENTSEHSAAMSKLQEITGLEPSSFQGAYKASKFTLVGSQSSTSKAIDADPYTGRVFSNHVEMADNTLLLPDGNWQGLAYWKTASQRGDDYFLLLSLQDRVRLSQLLVIRVQTVKDGMGFNTEAACELPADYASKTRENQALGPQLCYWSNYTAAPWQQPIYRVAANRLTALGFTLPEHAISSSFHKADSRTSVTTAYYLFPDSEQPTSMQTDWNKNPWNPLQLSKYPDQQKLVDQRREWDADWFQIFGVSQ